MLSLAITFFGRALLLLVTTGHVTRTDAAICEPIRIPMCQWLPYNLTHMPNLLYHSSQRNAQLVLEQFQPLIDSNCSSELSFYLCAMFSPMCPVSFSQSVIPPCRSVCESARQGCEPLLRNFKMSWPYSLRCETLPSYENGVCISPNSIVSNLPKGSVTDKDRSDTRRRTKLPKCRLKLEKQGKLKKLFMNNKYKYAMTAVFNRAETLDGGTVLDLHVTPRYVFYMRHRHSHISDGGDVRLWLPLGCMHGRVKPGQTYLILGTEDTARHRLVVNGQSYVKPWRPSILNRLKKWKKIRESNRRKSKKRHRKGKNGGKKSKHNKSQRRDKSV